MIEVSQWSSLEQKLDKHIFSKIMGTYHLHLQAPGNNAVLPDTYTVYQAKSYFYMKRMQHVYDKNILLL